MSTTETTDRTRVNDVLRALSRPECRRVVRYFQERSVETATLGDLAFDCAGEDRGEADTERVAEELHHAVLPQLDGVGVIDYDVRSSTVRYRGDRTTDAVLGALDRKD